MKICLLYHGAIRGLKYEKVINSHLLLIEKLKNLGNVDVFCQINNFEYSDVFLKLNPIVYEISDNNKNHKPHKFRHVKFPQYFTEQRGTNVMLDLYSQNRVFTIMCEYCNRSNVKYDLYVNLRYDLLLENINNDDFNDFKNFKLDKYYTINEWKYWGYTDMFGIGNYDITKIIMTRYELLMDKNFPRLVTQEKLDMLNFGKLHKNNSVNMHPESSIKILLELNKIYVEFINMTVKIVRTDGNIKCNDESIINNINDYK